MTWVIGGATPYGQAFVIGDTRVSFSDGREEDLVRKVYWIGKDLCAGFAGSVRIGFSLLTDLSQKLRPGPGQDGIWKPEAVAKRWCGEAAALFANHDELERRARCSILIAAVAPRLNGPFAETVLIELRSPRFEPRLVGRYGAIQIGNGRDYEVYRTWVEQYFGDRQFIANFGSWGTGLGAVLASSLSERVQQNPSSGVSHFMHMVACGRGEQSEARIPQPNPWEDVVDPFPDVATTYQRFEQLANGKGLIAAGATA